MLRSLMACSVIVTAVPLLAAEPAVPLVIGETFKIASEILAETRTINVYLPASYFASASARLPVLYMPDGGIAEDFLHVAGLVQVLVGNGTMRPFVLVGIENTQRRRDLTGPTANDEDRKIAPTVGGSAAFRRFIHDELMPQVRQRYRVTAESAILGESLAGLFVVETFFVEPQLFDSYIAIDPSLWWNGESLVRQAKKRLESRPGLEASLYLASSDEQGVADPTHRLARILSESAPAGLNWIDDPLPEERHSTIFHPAAQRAFRRMFKPIVQREQP